MVADDALAVLEATATALREITRFGRSDEGSPANAPWLPGVALERVDEALEAIAAAVVEIEDAGDDEVQILEPGTIGNQNFQELGGNVGRGDLIR